MKKFMAIPFTLALALSLTACASGGNDPVSPEDSGSSSAYSSSAGAESTAPDSSAAPVTNGASDSSSPQTSDSSANGETAEADTPADSGTIQKGDEGTGSAALNAGLIRLEIPEGLGYRVDSFYIDESNPFSGNATILILNENGHIAAKLIATTMNMVSSQEKAVENVISLRNLDSYTDGKSSVEGDTQYGENTYTLVRISTETFEKDYFVTYAADRYAADKSGLLISLEVDLEEISSGDELIKDVLNSITVVRE